MKNFQQNLLVALALGLCGLCAYQWYSQTVQRAGLEIRSQENYDQAVAIQNYTNSIKAMNQQIAQMDAHISELKQSASSNALVVTDQKREIVRLRADSDTLTNEVAQYKAAVDKLESHLKDAYDGIKKQNESVKELVTQRDDLVQKLNDAVKDRNDIVKKYNDLVDRVNKLQTNEAKKPE